MWLLVRLTLPRGLEKEARTHSEGNESGEEIPDWRQLVQSLEGWRRVANHYFMEWQMVWRDVVFGFTIDGIISAFVPRSFFTTLFVGSGGESSPAFWQVYLQTLIGPLAAFFTFIGSMGNIPLAALLYTNGVSFAGVMAFIFSDLVVFPVLRINAKYFGWRMAIYILAIFLASLSVTSIVLHYAFEFAGFLPQAASEKTTRPIDRFSIDNTFFLNLVFLGISGVFAWWRFVGGADEKKGEHEEHHHEHDSSGKRWSDRLLTTLALVSLVWLFGGIVAWFIA